MKSLEELRDIEQEIVNTILRNKLSVEEGIYVIEMAKWFLTTVKIVGDFDNLKLKVLAIKARMKLEEAGK